MPEKSLRSPSFKVEWCKSLGELLLLLDHDTLQYFARVGSVKSFGAGHHTVELTPQNGGDEEMIRNYFRQQKLPKTRRRRAFHAPSEPRRGPVKGTEQRVPKVSMEEQERRVREQAEADRLLELDRLNIFPPGSDERPCFNIRHGIRCNGTMELEEERSDVYPLPFLMWKCLICRDPVDKVVLQNRGVKIELHKKTTRGRKKHAVVSAEL